MKGTQMLLFDAAEPKRFDRAETLNFYIGKNWTPRDVDRLERLFGGSPHKIHTLDDMIDPALCYDTERDIQLYRKIQKLGSPPTTAQLRLMMRRPNRETRLSILKEKITSRTNERRREVLKTVRIYKTRAVQDKHNEKALREDERFQRLYRHYRKVINLQ
jgi:hypothetical protein